MSVVIADANVLLRSIIEDDTGETAEARKVLIEASRVAIPAVAICETLWVLRSRYKIGSQQLKLVLHRLLETENLILDRAAIEAGLDMMERGGDFADGIIAFDGNRLGGEVFATFDRKAAALLTASGLNCRLLQPHK